MNINGVYDIYLVKLDGNTGDVIFAKDYGESDSDRGLAVAEFDGGYAVTGMTESLGVGSADVFLLRTDYNGNQLTFNTIGTDFWDQGSDIIVTSDGGFMICGEPPAHEDRA